MSHALLPALLDTDILSAVMRRQPAALARIGWHELSNLAPAVKASNVIVNEDTLTVELVDGRTLTVPLAWYPRLLHGKPEERGRWELIGDGEGIHWPELDEDISVEGLILGRRSGESQRSFQRWLEARSK